MTPLPCLFLGGPLTGVERERLGLSHARDWAPCEHPDKPLGPWVCPCDGCGPKCQKYSDPDLESIE